MLPPGRARQLGAVARAPQQVGIGAPRRGRVARSRRYRPDDAPPQVRERGVECRPGAVGEGADHEPVHHAAASVGVLGGGDDAGRAAPRPGRAPRTRSPRSGHEQPRQGELVELGQVVERSPARDAVLARPVRRRGQAGPGARWIRARTAPGSGVRRGSSRAGTAARPCRAWPAPRRGRPAPAAGRPSAVYQRCRFSSSEACVAQLPCRPEMLLGGVEVALLAEYVGQPDVQVADDGQHRPGRAVGEVQRPLVQAARLVGSTRAPATSRRGRRWRPARRSPCRPACRLRTASVNVSTAASRSPAAQAARPRKPSAAPRARWSSGPARSSARRACVGRAGESPRAWATDGPVDRDHRRQGPDLPLARRDGVGQRAGEPVHRRRSRASRQLDSARSSHRRPRRGRPRTGASTPVPREQRAASCFGLRECLAASPGGCGPGGGG